MPGKLKKSVRKSVRKPRKSVRKPKKSVNKPHKYKTPMKSRKNAKRSYRMSMNKEMFKQLIKRYDEHNNSWFSSDKDKLSKPEIDMMLNYLTQELRKDTTGVIETYMFKFLEDNMSPELLDELVVANKLKKNFGYTRDDVEYGEKIFQNILEKHLKKMNKSRTSIMNQRLNKMVMRF